MITLRKSDERGLNKLDWLHSQHTFSFSSYYDPRFMGYSTLRVINEDHVEPDKGFGTHAHRDMEILTYVLSGQLEHRDSMGNGAVIKVGDVQTMSAGTGITHSEFNPSSDEKVHFLQIWILPEARDLKPRYEQKFFPDEQKRGKLQLVASRDGSNGSVTIMQNTKVYASLLSEGETVGYNVPQGRRTWLQVISGGLDANGHTLKAGDGAAIYNENDLKLRATANDTHFLLFDLQ
jgi:quercetin 2,3-dioxygenase